MTFRPVSGYFFADLGNYDNWGGSEGGEKECVIPFVESLSPKDSVRSSLTSPTATRNVRRRVASFSHAGSGE